MNRIFLSVLALGISCFSSAFAEEKRQDGVSGSGKIGWHIVANDDDVQVLISEADQGESAAQKLCDVPSFSHTKVFVSPDDKWIIVQTGSASLGISLNVFQREKGMIYQEKADLKIEEKALLRALNDKVKAVGDLDHTYANLIAWSADSKSILFEVSGQGDAARVESYFAIYDFEKQSIGFDLSAFNAKSVTR
jgi:hypothetical protein